jgi:hypothetical protein
LLYERSIEAFVFNLRTVVQEISSPAGSTVLVPGARTL